MNVQIEESWKKALTPEFSKDYFIQLTDFVRKEYHETTVYPPGKLIFNAFNLCPFDNVKVVIIGQDPSGTGTRIMLFRKRRNPASTIACKYIQGNKQRPGKACSTKRQPHKMGRARGTSP